MSVRVELKKVFKSLNELALNPGNPDLGLHILICKCKYSWGVVHNRTFYIKTTVFDKLAHSHCTKTANKL